jgi:hypothetical protein
LRRPPRRLSQAGGLLQLDPTKRNISYFVRLCQEKSAAGVVQLWTKTVWHRRPRRWIPKKHRHNYMYHPALYRSARNRDSLGRFCGHGPLADILSLELAQPKYLLIKPTSTHCSARRFIFYLSPLSEAPPHSDSIAAYRREVEGPREFILCHADSGRSTQTNHGAIERFLSV